MRKVIQLKEFDAVTCEADDEREYGKQRLSVSDFSELKDFGREYISNDEHADALEFMRIGYRRNVGDIVSFNNYVGLVQLPGGLQIEILPKVDFGNDIDDVDRTKRVFLKMLRSLKDFDGKVFGDANLNADRMNLYEIFINMYLGEVRHLVKKGIKSAYVGQEDNLKYYKGKLLVNEHIKSNLVHKERFFVGYDEFNLNRPENRLVKSTLLKLQKQTNSSENSKEIYRLLTFLKWLTHP